MSFAIFIYRFLPKSEKYVAPSKKMRNICKVFCFTDTILYLSDFVKNKINIVQNIFESAAFTAFVS